LIMTRIYFCHRSIFIIHGYLTFYQQPKGVKEALIDEYSQL